MTSPTGCPHYGIHPVGLASLAMTGLGTAGNSGDLARPPRAGYRKRSGPADPALGMTLPGAATPPRDPWCIHFA